MIITVYRLRAFEQECRTAVNPPKARLCHSTQHKFEPMTHHLCRQAVVAVPGFKRLHVPCARHPVHRGTQILHGDGCSRCGDVPEGRLERPSALHRCEQAADAAAAAALHHTRCPVLVSDDAGGQVWAAQGAQHNLQAMKVCLEKSCLETIHSCWDESKCWDIS